VDQGELPAELRGETERILLEAAAAGATLDDLKILAACALEKWRSQQPDPGGDDGFDDRFVLLDTTFGGAGCVRGDLTPECAAAVQAVLESLGKPRGPEDTRTQAQRFHDALQEGCELLLRARMVPDRAGADTQVIAHIGLSQLRGMPGASELEAAWLAAWAGEPGFLAGTDAGAAACDALVVPVVTGHPDWQVIDQIIEIALAVADPAGDRLRLRPGRDRRLPAHAPAQRPVQLRQPAAGHRVLRQHPGLDPPRRAAPRPEVRLAPVRPPRRGL
jgi:hypothetical protein